MVQDTPNAVNTLVGLVDLLQDSGLRPDQARLAAEIRQAALDLVLDLEEDETTDLRIPFDPVLALEHAVTRWQSFARQRGLEVSWRAEGLPKRVQASPGVLRNFVRRVFREAILKKRSVDLEVTAAEDHLVFRTRPQVVEQPLVLAFTPCTTPAPSLRRKGLEGVRVLLACSEPRALRVARATLEAAGCEVVCAASVNEVLLAVQEADLTARPIEAFLLDLEPGASERLVQELRLDPRRANTPYLLLASGGRPGDADHWRGLGCRAYLSKPLGGDLLQEALGAALADETKHLFTVHDLSESALARARVLVVDDSATNRALSQRYLQQLGHESEAASGGEEALELLRARVFDLILMDVEMPGCDGRETTRRLREFSAVPVVGVTGHAGHLERRRCLQAGMDDVLVKPVLPEALARIVQRWAGKEVLRPQAEPGHSSDPPVDINLLREASGNDPDLEREIRETFIEDIESRLQELEHSLKSSRADAVRTAAHSIKGSASYVGAGELTRKAAALEVAAESEALAAAPHLHQALRDEWNRVLLYLKPEPAVAELEFTEPPDLSPEQIVELDLHSFLNVINVVVGELYLLADVLGDRGPLRPAIELWVKTSQSLREPRNLRGELERMPDTTEAFWKLVDQAVGRGIGPEAEESLANLRSILAVLRVRVDEMLERLDKPDAWVPHNIEQLRANITGVLAAIEKNSKGRYHIVHNVASQDECDYLIHLDFSGPDQTTITMPPVLQDVFRDLIANARKYTPPGGTVHAGLADDGGTLRLVVEDNGRGIPAEELREVVKFGYRASNVEDVPTKGAGFGLTKALWVATRHGGSLRVRSGLGQGTRVAITLPRPLD